MAKDAPRQAQRRRRKSQGLPASEDVGILAEMLAALRTAAEGYLGNSIYYALAACPNLVALYREDIEDAFEYLSLRSLDNPNNLYRLFREPAGAEASYGLGLCHEPSNVDRCNKEQHEMPITTVLTVLYTRNALCVEVSVMNQPMPITLIPRLLHQWTLTLARKRFTTIPMKSIIGKLSETGLWRA